MDRFSFNRKRLEAFGHHGHAGRFATNGGNLNAVAIFNTFFLSQFIADFNVELRLHFQKPCLPTGQRAGAPVLGAGIRRADIGELLAGAGHFIHFTFEDFNGRVVELSGHRIFSQRAFQRFVMLRERTFSHGGSEQRCHTILFHNKRIFAFCLVRLRRPGTIRHVSNPFISHPFQNITFGIVRFAVNIAGSAIVNDAAIDRPGE